ncbi:sigma-70 family RNA polymerase sigma factor [Spiractinospora alimapuensis]|uniref:sigma-70 family RNA polymerase sigma factor n=1 Tax=Spiractinospora alimapuensis TaxID=2820884 RepID=UPI001F3EAA78|nr:sigma-70 family RNA polymerase sigma factor [Spiractinospora alimapuensis]QVQ51968.1 sigma-70 family RNA polymerase sigma factor [Spiractinospora alimapuensis]
MSVLMAHPTASEDFTRRADPYRRELTAHCYRMLGSIHDAEDLVQETYLRAWSAYERFEERASMRTWLYRIATNACLTALESRGRRPLPTDLAEAADPARPLAENVEIPWLQPAPDTIVNAESGDPGTVVADRFSVRLALVAALQHLPPRQRAVLVLRDVMRFRAAETAEALEMTTVAVNSLLQRARAQLAQVMPREDDMTEPDSAEMRDLLDSYAAAFQNYDIAAMVDLFRSDAAWEMPPFLTWVRGPRNIVDLITTHCPAQGPGDMVMVPTRANGQPAFALYMRDPEGEHRAFHLQVLTVRQGKVAHVSAFFDTSLFPRFGLPDTLAELRG